MTSRDISDAARELRRVLGHTSVAEFVVGLYPHHQVLFGEAVALNTSDASREIDAVKEQLQDARPDDLFVGINDILRAIDEFELRLLAHPAASPALRLRSTLTAAVAAYRAWLHDQTTPKLLALVLRTGELHHALDAVQGVLDTIVSATASTFEPGAGEALLRLKLQGGADVEHVTFKLVALQRLYDEAKEVTATSSNAPLTIVRFEVGSIDGDFLGVGKAIDFMRDALFALARYFDRRFTTAGKLKTLSEQIRLVDELLGLSQRLKASGLDAEQIEERVKKSAEIIGDQAERLLADQRRIVINDTEIYVGELPEPPRAGLAPRPPRLLSGDTRQDDGDDDGSSSA